MNILYLSNHLNTGGIASYLLTLAGGLKKRGHNIYLASSGGDKLTRFREVGANFIPIPIRTKAEISPGVLISFFQLLPEIKRRQIEIIHANTRVTQVLAGFLSRASGRPYLATCHGFFKNRFLRRSFPCWGERVIAISQQVKEHLLNDFHLPEKMIEVIHNGIDAERFSQAKLQTAEFRRQAKQQFGLSQAPVAGIIARLSEVKGHSYLIAAMSMVIKEAPDAQLLIIGEGKIKNVLEKLTRSLGIEKNVFFFPNVENTALALRAIDVFVQPSLQEGLGLGLIEAMAGGSAVIASRVGGIPTLIQDGDNGLLVNPGDSADLAVKIKDLLSNPAKRAFLGDKAREFIKKNFSQGKMLDQTERLYRQCAKTVP